jgi:hypothetical protein
MKCVVYQFKIRFFALENERGSVGLSECNERTETRHTR